MADTKAKIIHGETFQIRQPYDEGHVLTAAEAKALNQVRAENIGNNVRAQIKEAQDAGNTSGLEALVAEYDAKYEFSMGRVGGAEKRSLDPVEREARSIAREILKDHLAKSGRKLRLPKEASEEDKADWSAQVEAQIEELAANPQILKAAKKSVSDKKNLTDSIQLAGVEQRQAAE